MGFSAGHDAERRKCPRPAAADHGARAWEIRRACDAARRLQAVMMAAAHLRLQGVLPLFDEDRALREKALVVHERLCAAHGCPIPYFHELDPLSELMSALLSHRTRNADSGAAFRALRARYSDWSQVRDAPVAEVEALLAGVTWPEQKAPRLQAVLRSITRSRGGDLSLDFLADMPVRAARAWLERLPGCGAEDQRGGAAVQPAAPARAPGRQPPPRRGAARARARRGAGGGGARDPRGAAAARLRRAAGVRQPRVAEAPRPALLLPDAPRVREVFNVFTGTALHRTRQPPSRLVMILRGFYQGVPTLHLAQELGLSRRHLLPLRHRVQGLRP